MTMITGTLLIFVALDHRIARRLFSNTLHVKKVPIGGGRKLS
ncbi:MAG: hypothetical protein NVSMB22_23700 [Chloroflexota bacterium]